MAQLRSNGNPDMLHYYAVHSPITDPKEFSCLFADLPHTVREMVDVVQGLCIHIFWAERLGIQVTAEQQEHVQARTIPSILRTIQELNPAPLTKVRSFADRFYGNCRDHSVLLCAMLRSQGIPARVRCGFGTYFIPGHFEDHWVCEYWDSKRGRWVMVDPQLDRLQREALQIAFDTLDMPKGQFVTGAEAWQLARTGKADPDQFGIFDMHGLWFIIGNLIRDLAALNKMELLPWDIWGLMNQEGAELSASDYELLDEAADLIVREDPALYQIYKGNSLFEVPRVISSWVDGESQEVILDF